MDRLKPGVTVAKLSAEEPFAVSGYLLDPTAGAQDATFQERSVCAEIPINACRRLQYFQRPTPPHVSSITPGAPHCGDDSWREVVVAA